MKVPDKEQRQVLRRFPGLLVSRMRRHLKVQHPITGQYIVAPISGSDWRGLRNFERDLRRLAVGEGYQRPR